MDTSERYVALPALQKETFVDISWNLPGDFRLEKGGIFGEILMVCVFQEIKHERSSKISGKFNMGRKFESLGSFCSATFLT